MQNRQLGLRAVEILLNCLTSDDRTLELLNPDRIMLLGFNLGRLIESPDVNEKYLGLTISLIFLRNHPDILISDICTNEQIRARDIILKHQSLVYSECLKDLHANGRISGDFE